MEKTEILSMLQAVGLSENEARVYHALLVLGEASPSDIARRGAVKRPTAYVVLNRLVEKDFASKRTQSGGQELFRAVNPHVIVDRHKQLTSRLVDALPRLIALHPSFHATPSVSVYTGHEGIQKIWDESLTSGTEILYWADQNLSEVGYLEEQANRVSADLSFVAQYVNKRIAAGVWVRGIIPYEPDSKTLAKLQLQYRQKEYIRLKREGASACREFYFVPRVESSLQQEINIYEDKVAFISYKDLLGVVLKGASYVETYRIMFRAAFNYAKLVERGILSPEDLDFLYPTKGS